MRVPVGSGIKLHFEEIERSSILRIEHIALWTDQLEQLKDFYVKYFGAQVGNHYRNPKKLFESIFLSFASGSRMELMHQPGKANTLPSPGEPNIGYAHISFATGSAESVDELTNRLRQDGLEVIGWTSSHW